MEGANGVLHTEEAKQQEDNETLYTKTFINLEGETDSRKYTLENLNVTCPGSNRSQTTCALQFNKVAINKREQEDYNASNSVPPKIKKKKSLRS